MRKITLLFLLMLPFIGFAQNEQSAKQNKFGVGLGYNFNPVMGDSIRPIELAFRYRMGNKHTFELYTPLYFNKVNTKDGTNDVKKQTLYGIGFGYDYTFYTHSNLNFFAGISADYQWYQSRWDFHRINETENTDWTYYEWRKIEGISIKPNIGIRLDFERVTVESKIGITGTFSRHNRYSYSHKKYPASENESEMFFPDEKTNGTKIQPNLFINISYHF